MLRYIFNFPKDRRDFLIPPNIVGAYGHTPLKDRRDFLIPPNIVGAYGHTPLL